MSTIANMWEATNVSDFLYRIDVWWTMWFAFDFSLFGCTACTPMWVMERPSFLKSKHMGACQNWISLWWSKKCVLIQTQIYSVKSGGCFFNPQQWYKLFSHMYLHSIIFFGEKTSKLLSNNMWGSKLVEYTQTSNQETRTYYGGFLSHGATS